MGFEEKKEEFAVFAIVLIFVSVFVISNVFALNVVTENVSSTLMIVNITDAVNIYSYEVNFVNLNGGNSYSFYRVLGTTNQTSGTNSKNGIFYLYESRLQPGWPGITFGSSGLAVFNLTHPNTAIPRQVTTVNASGFEETVNLCTENLSCTDWSSCVGGTQTRTCNSTTCLYGESTQSQSCTEGGGGGGGETCADSWNCDDWSLCANNQQTRTCTYTGSCATPGGKPAETQSCTIVSCDADWNCSDWGECETGGIQRRTCIEASRPAGCTLVLNIPDTTRTCVSNCTENWNCDWSSCINNLTSPVNCVDRNNCGTTFNKPSPMNCVSTGNGTCIPNLACEEWSECTISYGFEQLSPSESLGRSIRVCNDQNNCVLPITEMKNCSMKIDINTSIITGKNVWTINFTDALSGKEIGSIEGSAGEFKIRLNPLETGFPILVRDFEKSYWKWWLLLLLLLIILILTGIIYKEDIKKFAKEKHLQYKLNRMTGIGFLK